MSEPRTTIDDLKVGQVVSVFEPDSTIGVYLVEEVKRAGFTGSLMTDDGPLDAQELTEFRVSAYRNHAGHEWFGIPGLTILSDSSWKPPLVLPTEPTWGIVLHLTLGEMLGVWGVVSSSSFQRMNVPTEVAIQHVRGWVPLTDEQIARIEAAR